MEWLAILLVLYLVLQALLMVKLIARIEDLETGEVKSKSFIARYLRAFFLG